MGIDPLTAGIGAVGSIVGGLLGSQPKTSSNTTAPWDAQQPYLKAGMQDAAGIYAGQRGTPYYTGSTYANMDPHTQAALNGIYGYQGQGSQNSNNLTGQGANLLNTGVSGLQGSIHNLQNYNPQDPTQQNINNAGMYANNPYLNGAIDAASRDVTRNLSEVQLPGIARGADANGDLNSSRTGIAEGIAMRGAQDQIGNIGSTMRANAYNNGLSLSQQANSTNQGDWLQAQSQAGSMAGNASITGMNGIGQGQGLYYNNADAASAAGGHQQQNAQGQLTNNFQTWQGQQARPWNLLGNYQNSITGAGTYPSTTTSGGGGMQGALQGALGGGASALGLYGSYQNLNQAQPTNGFNNNAASYRAGY